MLKLSDILVRIEADDDWIDDSLGKCQASLWQILLQEHYRQYSVQLDAASVAKMNQFFGVKDNNIPIPAEVIDLPFLIRPRRRFIGVDLKTITSAEELLSNISIEIGSQSSDIYEGAQVKPLYRIMLIHYSVKQRTFEVKDKTEPMRKKISLPIDELPMPEPEAQALLRGIFGQKMYWLPDKDDPTKVAAEIAPWIEGMDLVDIVNNKQDRLNALSVTVRKQIFLELLLQVGKLHNANFLHRDVKLDNVILDKENHPVLIDHRFLHRMDRPTSLLRMVTMMYQPVVALEKPLLPFIDLYPAAIIGLFLLLSDWNYLPDKYQEVFTRYNEHLEREFRIQQSLVVH
ncbi:MAG: hypothetical protein ACK4PR_10055, partial [Gammaproteobacteria bacterium]